MLVILTKRATRADGRISDSGAQAPPVPVLGSASDQNQDRCAIPETGTGFADAPLSEISSIRSRCSLRQDDRKRFFAISWNQFRVRWIADGQFGNERQRDSGGYRRSVPQICKPGLNHSLHDSENDRGRNPEHEHSIRGFERGQQSP